MPAVVFRRVGGRIVPIKSKGQTRGPKVNGALQIASTAAAAAGGVLSAATLFSGGRKFAVGQVSAIGLDVLSTTANVAAHSGSGHFRQRAKGLAKNEIINQAVGWGTFGGVLLFHKPSRDAGIAAVKGGVSILQKLLRRAV